MLPVLITQTEPDHEEEQLNREHILLHSNFPNLHMPQNVSYSPAKMSFRHMLLLLSILEAFSALYMLQRKFVTVLLI